MRAQSCYLRDPADAPPAQAVGLDGSEQPTLLVAQGGQERPHLPVVIPVRVVDPLQAFRAAALIWTRDRHFTLLRHDSGVLVDMHDVGFAQDRDTTLSPRWDLPVGC